MVSLIYGRYEFITDVFSLGLGLDFRDQDSEQDIVYEVFACKNQKTPTLL